MNLIFDLDGTLTDPFPGIARCLDHALTRMGAPAPSAAQLRACIGPPLKHSLARLLATEDQTRVERALALYRERFGTVGLYENAVYEGVPPVLTVLVERGHLLYVATSKPEVYARRIVDHFGLRAHFRAVYGSELDGTRADKADLLAHLLEREAIDANAAVMIGDRDYDMIGARSNRIAGLGVLWGYGSQAELEAAGAHAVIETPRDLIPALNRVPGFNALRENEAGG